MPDTIQTSPLHVQSAARPSGKKSMPVKRNHELYGFCSGAVRVSTTYGPGPFPTLPVVVTISVQCAGPPFVSGDRGSAATSVQVPVSFLERISSFSALRALSEGRRSEERRVG